MSMSIVTNVNSMVAQENLRVNSEFQGRTIQRLTSGYRINASGDDAAGLAVANKFRSDVSELTQGVRNANDGISQLQIIDGGVKNISNILDRMKTLATQSASTTFTGNRSTLNNEFNALRTEIDRQAANIGLNSGGTYNALIEVYIGGGGTTQTNSKVSVDLSGASNQVDAAGLGLSGASLLAGGTSIGSYDTRTATNGMILTGGAGGNTQVFTFHLASGDVTSTIASTDTNGITVADAVNQLNADMNGYGISAQIGSDGILQLSGTEAFTVTAAADSGGGGLATDASTARNTGMYTLNSATGAGHNPQATYALAAGESEDLTFTSGGQSVRVVLTDTNAATDDAAIATLNTALASLGIKAVNDADGNGVEFQSANDFSVSKAISDAGVFAAAGAGWSDGDAGAPAVSGSTTGNALAAITSINAAVTSLGTVQGRVGTGQNKLSYAVSLAQSQIANFSAAESRIRDADVASEAANLTKAQVMQQASLAAMAQANSAPQALLALLRG